MDSPSHHDQFIKALAAHERILFKICNAYCKQEADKHDLAQEMIVQLPRWKGSLEDGCVMLTALQYQCPIWPYNFRDFGTFRKLTFWIPNDSG